jgi:hypothetical protein
LPWYEPFFYLQACAIDWPLFVQASINLFEWRVIAVYTSRLWAHVLRPATVSALALAGASTAAVVCVSWLTGYAALLVLSSHVQQGLIAFAVHTGRSAAAVLPTALLVPGPHGTTADVVEVSAELTVRSGRSLDYNRPFAPSLGVFIGRCSAHCFSKSQHTPLPLHCCHAATYCGMALACSF